MLFNLWDWTTGAPRSKREAYVGAKLFARFLLSEIKRRDEIERTGETNVVRRGLVMPQSVLNAWAWNILEDCLHHRVPPPKELLDVIYIQLNCSHLTNQRGKPHLREKGEDLLRSGHLSLRKIAGVTGVNVTTVSKWRDELPDKDIDYAEFNKLREQTHVHNFYPMRYRVHHE